jgi:hypothetical protein
VAGVCRCDCGLGFDRKGKTGRGKLVESHRKYQLHKVAKGCRNGVKMNK